MNDLQISTDDVSAAAPADERQLQTDERRWLGGLRHWTGVDESDRGGAGTARSNRLFVAIIAVTVILFWVAQYSSITLVRMIRYPDEGQSYLVPRALASTFGMLQALAMLAIQWRIRRRSLSVRAVAALGLALIGAFLHANANQLIFVLYLDDPMTRFVFGDSLIGIIDFFWYYLCLSAIILALAYAADIREREERINALLLLSHAAQLRALRNQLNPHFLFNTLNAITGLISRGRSREAERMTESLADFLRTTLVLDPHRQITLGEEIALQGHYLAIEKARFPQRLNFSVHVPEALEGALVPGLITQPLIENSIKYAVARSSEPVRLNVVAWVADGKLELVVEDDGGNAETAAAKGAGVGLANVAERLRAHYGEEARLDAGRREEGGFRNRIILPLQLAT